MNTDCFKSFNEEKKQEIEAEVEMGEGTENWNGSSTNQCY